MVPSWSGQCADKTGGSSALDFRPPANSIIETPCAGCRNGSFHVDCYMAGAAIEMLKANAIEAEDFWTDQEILRVNGVSD
ncbi:hypothetical protein E2P81_ATG02746 [Venturia nashicola]|nr:hypothetical protein E2P81_ATG02746 [Venturia nashicola]